MYVFEGPVYLENKEREVIYQGSHGLVWQKGVLTQKEHFVKVNIGNVTVYLSSCLNLTLYISGFRIRIFFCGSGSGSGSGQKL